MSADHDAVADSPSSGQYTADIATRRKNNAPERRRQLADAAIVLLGTDGSRGLSHPRVDVHAEVPAGTTSFYFRTRKALLQGAAERLAELDLADLARLQEVGAGAPPALIGTAGLAQLVMFSASEPWLTRLRARCELLLHASRDTELSETLQRIHDGFYGIADVVVRTWYPPHQETDPVVVAEQARAVLTFVHGVMMSFMAGSPVVDDVDHLERLLNAVVLGVTSTLAEDA